MNTFVHPSDRLIVALDTPDANTAFDLAERLRDDVRFFKIGVGHLGSDPVSMGRELRRRDFRVFLDLKLFDIDSTVRRAIAGVIDRAEPDFITVHGDPRVVAAARQAREGAATRILAITVLTSLTNQDLHQMMMQPGGMNEIVQTRARRALDAGADGLIAAPTDIAALRSLPSCATQLIVSPGIRMPDAPPDDQARTASALEAFRAGADHVVVGRPILCAPNPRQAARRLLASCGA